MLHAVRENWTSVYEISRRISDFSGSKLWRSLTFKIAKILEHLAQTLEEFEKGGLSLKTHQIFFVHSTQLRSQGLASYRPLRTRLYRLHWAEKTQCHCFRKVPFSDYFGLSGVDSKPNRRNKAAFS